MSAAQRETWAAIRTWHVESADGEQHLCTFQSGSLAEWRETLDRLFGVRYGNEQLDRYAAMNTYRVIEARP